jgi:hypothetical protein
MLEREMTTLIGRGEIEIPCKICGKKQTWILRYLSSQFDAYISLCAGCRRPMALVERAPAGKRTFNRVKPVFALTTHPHG